MAPKHILLIALVLANFPVYRFLFRVLFAKSLASAASRPEGAERKKGLALLFDPEFLRDGGGETKLFLLLVAGALAVYAEYSLILALFPALAGQ